MLLLWMELWTGQYPFPKKGKKRVGVVWTLPNLYHPEINALDFSDMHLDGDDAKCAS